jgi:hypothetical protein
MARGYRLTYQPTRLYHQYALDPALADLIQALDNPTAVANGDDLAEERESAVQTILMARFRLIAAIHILESLETLSLFARSMAFESFKDERLVIVHVDGVFPIGLVLPAIPFVEDRATFLRFHQSEETVRGRLEHLDGRRFVAALRVGITETRQQTVVHVV